jgi:predicted polyphosphate/ATP-dependent NAD kinase
LVEKGVGVLLFAGGDETARDISETIDRLAVLGIPCSVRNCSAVFAVSREAAAEVATSYLRGEVSTVDTEVLGFNESLMREDKIATKICALLGVLSSKHFMQGAKTGSYTPDEEDEQNGIAKFIAEDMNSQFQHISGLGSTTNQIEVSRSQKNVSWSRCHLRREDARKRRRRSTA